MKKIIAFITAGCLIVPVMVSIVWYVVSFVDNLNYVDIKKTVDYDTVITIDKNYGNLNEEKYMDEKLDAELSEHHYTSMSYKDTVSILKQVENTDAYADVYAISRVNGDVVYIDGREFAWGTLILTEDSTYMFIEYYSHENRYEYTMYTMTDGHLDRAEFSYLEKQDKRVYSHWMSQVNLWARRIFYWYRGVFIVLFIVFVFGLISAGQEIRRITREKKNGKN